MDHVWHPHPIMPYLLLQGYTCALVRTKPLSDGRYVWIFRNVHGFSDTFEHAKDCVEAGAEFFQTFRRNPWS